MIANVMVHTFKLNHPALLFFIMLLPALLSAQSRSIPTPHGYRFINHTNKRSKKPQIGETVSTYVDVWVGDQMLSSSRKSGSGLYQYDLPDTTTNHVTPVIEAALMMSVGDSATIYQKIDDYMRQFIPEGKRNEKELAFNIVLVGIQSVEDKQRMAQRARERAIQVRTKVETVVQDYTLGRLDSRITTTASGLKILVEEPGNGAHVVAQEAVQVHYFAFLTDGSTFDNSFERREPLAFPVGVGQMIPGFDEGVLQLRHGSKAYLFVPPALGYGEETPPTIPKDSELIFYVEVL